MILKSWMKAVAVVATGLSLSLGSTSAMAGDDGFAQKLLGKAMQLIGVKYRFGGTNPETGLDCSGYVQYVYKSSVGVNLPRTAAEQARMGERVATSEVRPGDMVFFNTRGFNNSHVGIYVGNGMFVHAPNSRSRVRFDSLESGYWKTKFTGVRRVSGPANNSAFYDNLPKGM
ncbi:MAG: C40 family peptidase [Burkholderiaceae bacterium]